MELAFLRQFEGKKVRIVLKNNFSYTAIIFEITPEGLLEFQDRGGDVVSIEPEFIAMISKLNLAEMQENEKW